MPLALYQHRKQLPRLLVSAPFGRNVEELQSAKLPEQGPVTTQMGDVWVNAPMSRIDVSKCHNRVVVGNGIGNAQWKTIRERDGALTSIGCREQLGIDFAAFDEVIAL